MTSPVTTTSRLHFVVASPVAGLAVAERRVERPRASVVCVHGALDRGASFGRLARRLPDFDVVAYDRRGYQGSRDLTPVDLDHHVDDLCTLVAREALEHRVIVVGHSFGGLVAMGAALREPSQLGLVVAFESPFPWLVRREGSRPPASDDPGLEAERFFRRVMSDATWERLSEAQRESRRRDGPALLVDLTTLHRPHAPFDIEQLRVPTIYAYGDAHAEHHRQLARALEQANPLIASAAFETSTHAAHLKNPDQLATLVRSRWEQTCASA